MPSRLGGMLPPVCHHRVSPSASRERNSLQTNQWTRRWGQTHDGAGQLVVAALGVQVLPHPPGAVDLGVVEEEHGVARRDEDVAARVAGEGEVAGAVHAVHVGREVALQRGGEAAEVLGLRDEPEAVAVLGLPLRQVGDDVAPDAARVVAEPVAVGHVAGEGGADGSKILDGGTVLAESFDANDPKGVLQGVRTTFMSLKGPDFRQPPPLPGGSGDGAGGRAGPAGFGGGCW